MKSIRRYYTRKQVAELLGVKSYAVTSRLIHLEAVCKQEIKRQLRRMEKLQASRGRYTEFHIEAIKEYYNIKPNEK